jgi:hypothetical protein
MPVLLSSRTAQTASDLLTARCVIQNALHATRTQRRRYRESASPVARSLGVYAPRDDSGYTREPRRRCGPPREYFTGFRFGSIFVRPVPLFTFMI